MTDYLTEQEQIEQLKNWIKQYGLTIVLGIVVALLITSGWRYWQNYQQEIARHASQLYDDMLAQRAQNNAAATTPAKKLIAEHPKTAYADMAALLLARNAVLKKNYPEAVLQLNWVIDHSQIDLDRTIARTRLARILIAQHKPDEAVNTLKQINDLYYRGLIDEIRGDAYVAKNDPATARKFYQLALQEVPNAEVSQPILEMKLNNLTTEKN